MPWPYLARSSICAQADHLMRWQWDVCTAASGMTSLQAGWTNRRGELPKSPQAREQIGPTLFFGAPSEQKPFSLLKGACVHPIQIHRLHLRAIWFGACHRWPSRIDRQICKIGFSALRTALAKNVRPIVRLVAQTRKEQLIRRLLFRASRIYQLLVWRSVDRTNFLIAFKFLGILLPNGRALVTPRRE